MVFRMITSVKLKDLLSQAKERKKNTRLLKKKNYQKLSGAQIIYYFRKNLKNTTKKFILAWKKIQ